MCYAFASKRNHRVLSSTSLSQSPVRVRTLINLRAAVIVVCDEVERNGRCIIEVQASAPFRSSGVRRESVTHPLLVG